MILVNFHLIIIGKRESYAYYLYHYFIMYQKSDTDFRFFSLLCHTTQNFVYVIQYYSFCCLMHYVLLKKYVKEIINVWIISHFKNNKEVEIMRVP